eukprot:16071_1
MSWQTKRILACVHLNDEKRRTIQRRRNVQMYEYEMKSNVDGKKVPTIDRSKRQTVPGTKLLKSVSKSDYKLKKIKMIIKRAYKELFNISFDKEEIVLPKNGEHANNAMCDPVSITKFFLTMFMNVSGFEDECIHYKTEAKRIEIEYEQLFDAKSMKNSKDKTLSAILGRAKEIFTKNNDSPFKMIPIGLVACNDNVLITKLNSNKSKLKHATMRIPIYKDDEQFDPFEDIGDGILNIFDETNAHASHFVDVTITTVTRNGDWSANKNGTGGASCCWPYYKRVRLAKRKPKTGLWTESEGVWTAVYDQ